MTGEEFTLNSSLVNVTFYDKAESGSESSIKDIAESAKVSNEVPSSHCVDSRMIPAKLCFFLLSGFKGAIIPYLTIFLASTGLDMKEAGFITGMHQISSLIVCPFWGYLADRTGKRKLIFVILCVGTAVTIFPMPWVARAFKLPTALTGETMKSNESVNVSSKSLIKYDNVSSGHTPFSSDLFYVMLCLVFISNMFSHPTGAFIDVYVTNVIKTNPKETDYGKQRMFGSLSFGLSSFLAGFVSDHIHQTSLSNYTGVFYVFLPSIVFLLPSGIVLASQTNVETKEERVKVWPLVLSTFRNIGNIMFMLSLLIAGMMEALSNCFLYKLMDEQMHATKTIMGLATLITTISELIAFPFAKTIFRALGGPICGIQLALFSFFVRFIAVSFVTNPWFVLPLSILNSVSFPLFWCAAIEYTQMIAKKEIYVTMFTIMNVICWNVASFIGSSGGGFAYDRHGGKKLFQASAYLCLIWLVIMIICYQVTGCIWKWFQMRREENTQNTYALDILAGNSLEI